MTNVLFTIAFRNFRTRFKTVLVLILGIGVPSMLLVGGLSINDSIGNWIERSLVRNFGTADAYLESRRSNLFFRVPLDEKIVDALRNRKEILGILPVSETMARLTSNGQTVDCLAMGVSSKALGSFVGTEVKLPRGKVIVSRDLAESLGIHEGDTVNLDMGRGNVVLEVVEIGESGFLNFRGDHLQYAGTVFVNKDDFQGIGGFPTRIYLHLAGNPEDHETIVAELKRELGVGGNAMKERLLKSPANKALGYLTIVFSGFSFITSLILVYIFAQSFVEERSPLLATFRILGMRSRHVTTLLILEGTTYLVVAGFLGGTLGILLGGILLKNLRTVVRVMSTGIFHPDLSGVGLHVTSTTILIGVFGGLVLPLLVFTLRVARIVRRPPNVELHFARRSSHISRSSRTFVGLAITVAAIVLGVLHPGLRTVAILMVAIGTLVVFPSRILSLGWGVWLILSTALHPLSAQSSTVWDALQRGGVFFVGSWMVFLPIVAVFRKLVSGTMTKRSVSALIALSYVERYRTKTFVIASMFSLMVFVMILVVVLPYNIEGFVRDRLKTGIFGYDFMVIRNPLKLIFKNEGPAVAEGLEVPSRVYVAELNGDLLAFVDEAFLRDAIVPIETDKKWRRELLEPGTVVVGVSNGTAPSRVDGKMKSPFGLGSSKHVSFKVVATFDMRRILVPVKYVASVKSMPPGSKLLPVLLGKVDPHKANEVKDFYRKRFDFPIYVTEELNRIFAGVDILVRTGLMLLYFGLISGFSGIAFHTLRSVITRKRLMGTLRAMGMSGRDLGLVFLLESFTISSIGIAVGVFSGVLEARDVVRLILTLFGSGEISFPFWGMLVLVLSVYAVIGAVVILPVFLASRTSPVEALKSPE